MRLPDYHRVDVGVYYETERFSVALNFENLFDEYYFIGGNGTRVSTPETCASFYDELLEPDVVEPFTNLSRAGSSKRNTNRKPV